MNEELKDTRLMDELEKFSPEELAAVQKYNSLIQQLGGKLAKRMAKPGTIGVNWTHGVVYMDEQAPAIVEHVMKIFLGEMSLAEFVAFCGSMAGYQAGAARAKGFDLPDSMFAEAGEIFAAGMHLIALNAENNIRDNSIALVPGLRSVPTK